MTKLSRSKLELFLDCPRCFWLDMNKKLRRVPPAPYTINLAIDSLLKEEFDICREKAQPHDLMKRNNIHAVPFKCERINDWRNNFTGIQSMHQPSGFLVFGAVDDIWIDSKGELSVVDYKATGAKEYKIYDSYKRQIEIYQWLLKQNDYKVSGVGYFVFAKVNKSKGFPEGKLAFDLFVEPLEADCSWVEGKIFAARKILDSPMPAYSENCKYCNYVQAGK